MQIKKNLICRLFYLGIKVIYLFITGKRVNSTDIGKSYDGVSKTYQQEYLKIMHVYNEEILNHLIDHVSQGRILDLAGGTGYNSCYLQKYNNYSIDLVDISSKMLEQCQCSGINKICAGMLEYLAKQETQSYDAIICTWALMYEKPQKILVQCQRLLKKDGYLYILVNDKQTLPQVRKIYLKLLVEHVTAIKKVMIDLPTPKNIQQLHQWAKYAGLKSVKLSVHKQDFIFKNYYQAAKFVVSTGALAGYDVMLDLKDEKIFDSFSRLLKQSTSSPCITHHFIIGVFEKR